MTVAAPDVPAAPRRLDPQRLPDHLDRLHRAALGLCRTPEDAEDLVQDTCAQVLARPRTLRRDDDLGYLLRALHNTFATRWRAHKRAPALESLPPDLELPADGHDEPGARMGEQAMLELVRELPRPFREAVVAVDVVGLSYRQAASALGTCEGTIMSRLHRGRARLARSLEPVAA